MVFSGVFSIPSHKFNFETVIQVLSLTFTFLVSQYDQTLYKLELTDK